MWWIKRFPCELKYGGYFSCTFMYTFNAEVISTAASPRQRNAKFKSIEHCSFNLLLNAHQLLQMHLSNSLIRWSLVHEKLERWQVWLLLQFTSSRVSDMKWQWACQPLHFLIWLSQCTWSIASKADLHYGCSMNASYIATTTNQTFASMPNKSWRFSPGSSMGTHKSNKIEAHFCCLYKCCWSNLILQRTKSYIWVILTILHPLSHRKWKPELNSEFQI